MMLLVVLAVLVVTSEGKPANLFRTSVTEEQMTLCHTGYRDTTGRCHGYANKKDTTVYPEIAANCSTVTWQNASTATNWGNCFNMTTDEEYRYGKNL
eukprot:sb/3479010/